MASAASMPAAAPASSALPTEPKRSAGRSRSRARCAAAPRSPSGCPSRREQLLRTEKRDHGQNPAMIVRRVRELQLLEDVPHVLLDGAVGDPEAPRDAGVRPALGHESQNVALARRQPLERIACAPRSHELLDQGGVDDGPAGADAPERVAQLVDVTDTRLQ